MIPLAAPKGPIDLGNMAEKGEEMVNGQFGDGLGIGAGGMRDRDAPLAGRVEINGLQAHRRAGDKPQAWSPVHDILGDGF